LNGSYRRDSVIGPKASDPVFVEKKRKSLVFHGKLSGKRRKVTIEIRGQVDYKYLTEPRMIKNLH
jgi:hypothetical protein